MYSDTSSKLIDPPWIEKVNIGENAWKRDNKSWTQFETKSEWKSGEGAVEEGGALKLRNCVFFSFEYLSRRYQPFV